MKIKNSPLAYRRQPRLWWISSAHSKDELEQKGLLKSIPRRRWRGWLDRMKFKFWGEKSWFSKSTWRVEFERLAVGKKRRAYEDGTHAPRPTVVAKKKSSPSVGESAVCVETAGSPRTKPRNCLETGVRPINSVSSDALTYQTLSRARGEVSCFSVQMLQLHTGRALAPVSTCVWSTWVQRPHLCNSKQQVAMKNELKLWQRCRQSG